MKKTQLVDAFREIQKRFVSFMSIAIIILIGAGAFFVTNFISAGSAKTGTEYYERLNYMDLQMVSSLGISADQVREIAAIEGVEDAEGVIQLQGKMAGAGSTYDITLLSTTDRINIKDVIEGRLPTNSGECAIAADLANLSGISIGDKVTLSVTFNDQDPLLNDSLVVTGIFNHPSFVRRGATYSVMADKTAFNDEVLHGLYTRVVITQKDNDENTFYDAYFDRLGDLKNSLDGRLPQFEESSVAYVKGIYSAEIDEKEAEANAQLDDAQKELDEAREKAQKELNNALYKINAGQQELDAAYSQIASAESQIAAGESELSSRTAEYLSLKNRVESYGIDVQALYDTLSGYEQKLAGLSALMSDPQYLQEYSETAAQALVSKLNEYIGALEELKSHTDIISEFDPNNEFGLVDYINEKISDAQQLIARIGEITHDGIVDGSDEMYALLFNRVKPVVDHGDSLLKSVMAKIQDYLSAESRIASARQQLENARAQLEAAKAQYEDGVKQLSAARSQYEKKKAEVNEQLSGAQDEIDRKRLEAQEAIADARKELESLSCSWVLTDRRAETCYNELASNINSIKNAGTVFGILFAFVGGLVCFSTLIIIIEEEKKYVGTTKAFGFHNLEILGKYLIFGIASAILGIILSLGVSVVMAGMMQKAIAALGMFNTGVGDVVIDYRKVIYVTIGIIAGSIIVTVLSCMSLLRSSASDLMKGQSTSSRPKKQKKEAGKQRGTLYSRLIVRNMVNDLARVIVSIIIVAGSVLVIGTGISLRDSFRDMLTAQTEYIDRYDLRVDLGTTVDEKQKEKIEQVFIENGIEYVPAAYKGLLYLNNGVPDGIYVLVTETDEIRGFINIKDPKTKEDVAIPEQGMLVQNRMVENKKLSKGDSFTIYDGSLNRHTVTYAGQYNNYVGRQIIMSRQAYEEAFDTEYVSNCFYIRLNGNDPGLIKNMISSVSSDLSYYRPDSVWDKFKSIVSLYNIVVVVMLGFAVIMSFMILTNLANIFINRKKKELIVMRINGFSIKKTREYLTRETILTTILGLIAGVVLGSRFITVIIKAMEQPDTQFVRTFNTKAWVIAVAVEAVFALIIYTLSFRKIKDLNFREIA